MSQEATLGNKGVYEIMHENLILRAGDWVEIQSPSAIAQTLDENGSLDGLPFMPEMAALCGQRFQVVRQAEKTCFEVRHGSYTTREFLKNDVFMLRGLRCTGANHDGCQRLCAIFWKRAWLKKVEDGHAIAAFSPCEMAPLSKKLKTKTSATRYFCQSTELAKATEQERINRKNVVAKAFRDIRSGAVGALEMIPLLIVPFARKMRNRFFGKPRLLGTLRKTPVGNLQLQPGEIVEIKTIEEMRATLDMQGRNRGLICDLELRKFCGRKYRVLSRLDRMISEATGEMRKVEGTVYLDGNLCMCAWSVGGCPRQEYCYWREIWLKRVDPGAKAKIEPGLWSQNAV